MATLKTCSQERHGRHLLAMERGGIPMKDNVQTAAPVRRAVLAAAAAAVVVLGGLVGAICLDEAIDHGTTSVVAGGGLWGG
jgi:hypothetical protein